jgi:hypothetical protein
MSDHGDRIGVKLESLSSDLVESRPTVYTNTGTEGEMGKGETFTTSGVKPEEGVNGSQAKPRKRVPPDEKRCTAQSKSGDRCLGWRSKGSDLCSGHGAGFGRGGADPREAASRSIQARSSRSTEARDRAAGDGERLGLALGGAPDGAAPNRNPLVALRALLEADPEAVAEYGMKAIREGRDVRALMSILDRVYTDDAHVDEPHSFDELAKLSPSERRQLLTQLEQEGRVEPFRADAWRSGLARREDERRAELATLSREERRILAADLAALEGG